MALPPTGMQAKRWDEEPSGLGACPQPAGNGGGRHLVLGAVVRVSSATRALPEITVNLSPGQAGRRDNR